MDLPVSPPVAPMLAKAVKALPRGDLLYEPKWDGFRAVVFRDGDEVDIRGRNGKPLGRYFPELVEGFARELPSRCVLDGEIIVRQGQVLEFEVLQQRIHPAASRITLLAEQTPASYVVFDLLALGDESLMETPFGERRARLTEVLGNAKTPVHVTPATDDYDVGLRWFSEFEGAGLDGVIAKPLDGPYEPDKRAMFKVKPERTADCVVAGFRWHKSGPIVGSLLLGLYNSEGRLQHVGVAASFPMARRAELVEELEPYRLKDLSEHPWGEWAAHGADQRGSGTTPAAVDRMPGAVSRWTGKKDLSWVALRPELVCEVAYEAMEGERIRHTARFRRWRTDRTPQSCTYEQLEVPVAYDLDDILGGT
jgi:ATP-dependent DNA ligase